MSLLSRCLNVFRRDRVYRELDDELQFHLAARAEELARQGIAPEQAERQAKRQLGNTLLLRESSSDIKLLPWLDSVVRDIGFGLRLCRKNAIVTAAAVVSLSLAIGACTAAFSLIDALILRPLPVHEPERLVYVAYRSNDDSGDASSFNYPLFERMRAAAREHIQLFGMGAQGKHESFFDGPSGPPDRVYGQWISGDAFELLGIRPALGRLLAASDDLKPGQHPVAVISYDFWTRRFGRSPSALGRWVTIRDKHLQIVGVTEKGFTGTEPGIMTDLWAPNMMWSDNAITNPGWSWFRIWGRLQPGVASEQARAVLQTVFTEFRRERAAQRRADEPRERIERYLNTPIYLRQAGNGPSGLRERFERPLWVLGLIAILVLLIASFNVASLLIARAAAREKEMALRISVGAGRGRLIQQMLVESAILSIAACAVAALLAVRATPAIVSLLSTTHNVVRLDLQLDWRLLAFLAAAGTLTTVLFGLAPALRASAASPNDALKSGGAKQTSRVGLFRPLIGGQTAFSFVVLFVSGLFLTSFARLVRTDLGFDSNNLVIIDVEARAFRQGGTTARAVWAQLLDRLKTSPGVQSTSLSQWGLFEGSSSTRTLRVPGRIVDTFEPYYLPVSPGFLQTMRIGLLDGRDLEWRDSEPEWPSAVIVNESFARRYFPGESAIGKRFSYVGRRDRQVAQEMDVLFAQEIIGVAADAKYRNIREPMQPTVYYPVQPTGWMSVQIRTQLEPAAVAALLRDELPRVHPTFRVTNLTLQSTLVDDTLVRERVLAMLSAFFSIVAVVLVAVGLYGVLSYSVVQRTPEIGIRLALGARQAGVVRLVLAEIGLATTLGVVAGLAAGIVAGRFITALLYEVKPSDLWSIAAPLVCLLLACALSALLPALRATRVDPIVALRYE